MPDPKGNAPNPLEQRADEERRNQLRNDLRSEIVAELRRELEGPLKAKLEGELRAGLEKKLLESRKAKVTQFLAGVAAHLGKRLPQFNRNRLIDGADLTDLVRRFKGAATTSDGKGMTFMQFVDALLTQVFDERCRGRLDPKTGDFAGWVFEPHDEKSKDALEKPAPKG